jgi:hypothetical protein
MDCFASLAMTARESGGSLLLRQRRMWPAEVGGCRILANLDNAAASGIATCPEKCQKQKLIEA